MLLAEGRIDQVLEAVRALVARNESLERQLASMMRRASKSNEGVSKDQLRLFLDKLQPQEREPGETPEDEERSKADARLMERADAAVTVQGGR